MHIVKDTPLELGYFVWKVRPPRPSLTVVVKAAFALGSGGTFALARKQRPVSGEVYYDEDEKQSVRTDSDLAVLKTAGECFLAGHCHAPGGEPATTVGCGFSVGSVKRALVVHGDRVWNKGIFANSHSKPEAFTKMPLRWERAYGGPGFAANPVGRGRAAEAYKDGARVHLPNIESASQRVEKPSDEPAPAGAFPIVRSWAARTRHLGTYEGDYMATRWPYFPEDFSWEYFSAAPPAQRIEGYWKGDEEITLQHMHPTQASLRGRLPGLKPRAFLLVQRGTQMVFEEARLELDTITVDADAWEAHCVWRGLVEVDDEELSKVGFLFVTQDKAGVARTPAEVRAAFDRARQAANLADDAFKPEAPPEHDDVAVELEDDDDEPLTPEAHAAALAAAKERAAERMFDAQFDAEMAKNEATAAQFGAPEPPPSKDATVASLAEAAQKAGLELPEGLLALLSEVEEGPETVPPPPPDEPVEPSLRETIVAKLDRGESLAKGDYTGADLSGLDLAEADFTEAILTKAVLARAALAGAKLDGAVLAGASLASANLTGASLAKADLTGADLTGAMLTRANLTDATAAEAKFNRANLEECSAKSADFSRATFLDAKAMRANFATADFTAAKLERADFSDSSLFEASLEGASGKGVVMNRAVMTRARVGSGAQFPYGQFKYVKAVRSVWTDGRFERADFTFAELEGADFGKSSLLKAKLNGCNLRGARFDGAQVQMAFMLGSDALAANFGGADLSFTDARGTNFFSAEFYKAVTVETQFELANLKRTAIGEK